MILLGLIALGGALAFYEVMRGKLSRQSLLIGPETLTDDEIDEAIPDDAPSPPDGYGTPRLPEGAVGIFQEIMWLIPIIPLVWVSGMLIDVLTAIHPFPPSPDGWVGISATIAVFIIMAVVHELVHAGTMKLFGHSVSFGQRLPFGLHVTINGALIRRWTLLVFLGAPLVIVTAGFIIGGFLAEGWVASVLINGAVYNILVSCGDVYQMVETLKNPTQSLFYYPVESGSTVRYEPNDSSPPLLTRIERQIEAVVGPSLPAQTDT